MQPIVTVLPENWNGLGIQIGPCAFDAAAGQDLGHILQFSFLLQNGSGRRILRQTLYTGGKWRRSSSLFC
jgi:hypothetical protein